MGLDYRDFFHFVEVVEKDVAACGFFDDGFWDVGLGLGVRGLLLVVGEGEVVVLRVWRDCTDAAGVEGCYLLVEELHVADVVDEDNFFQHYDESLPVHLDCHHHAVEGEFAYCRVFLAAIRAPPFCLCLVFMCTFVFTILSNRGVNIIATREVEKSCSTSDMSSS